MRDPLEVGDLMADETAAGRAAFAYFDAQNKGGIISISVAELVRNAGQQTFKRKDGSEGKVIDKIPADRLEEQLRGRAKHFGVTVMEHRAATDLPGMKSEMDAILANLGAIPTELTLGGEDLKVTASIFGTIKGEAKIGSAKVEGEASSEGVEGSVKVPGATLKGSVGEKGIKASLKLGELVTIDGGLNPKSDGSVDWKAEISVGTIGKLIMPEDVAKVFSKTQKTFAESAGELVTQPRRSGEGQGARIASSPRRWARRSRRPRRAPSRRRSRAGASARSSRATARAASAARHADLDLVIPPTHPHRTELSRSFPGRCRSVRGAVPMLRPWNC